MIQLIIPVDMVVKIHGERKYALSSLLATNNVRILHYSNVPTNSKYAIGGNPIDIEFNNDDVTKWVKDNINPIIFDAIPYLDDPIFSHKYWYQLVAIFENDNDALLFKMRWL